MQWDPGTLSSYNLGRTQNTWGHPFIDGTPISFCQVSSKSWPVNRKTVQILCEHQSSRNNSTNSDWNMSLKQNTPKSYSKRSLGHFLAKVSFETLKHPFGPTHHNNWARGPPHLLFRLVVTLYQLYAMCTLHWNSLNLQNSLAENSAEIWNDGSKLPGSLFPCCKFSLLHDFSCMILPFRTQYNQNVFLDFSIKKGSKTLHQ